MSEQHELEEIKCVKCAEDKIVPEDTMVYVINENVVGPSGENVPCEKIVTANMDNYGQGRQYYNQGAGQPSFYQQQRVGGQPVYYAQVLNFLMQFLEVINLNFSSELHSCTCQCCTNISLSPRAGTTRLFWQ